jgi:hypothetical protein
MIIPFLIGVITGIILTALMRRYTERIDEE